jgi:hypothetical protein
MNGTTRTEQNERNNTPLEFYWLVAARAQMQAIFRWFHEFSQTGNNLHA